MNFLKRFQKPDDSQGADRPPAVERQDLEQTSSQHNLCYWASRDVPHTQLRFLSVWTSRASGEAEIGLKVMATNQVRYWVYAKVPPGAAQDAKQVQGLLEPIFAANGSPNAPFFPALPTLFQVAENGLLPSSILKEMVLAQMQSWDGANVRNFSESVVENLSTEQALRRRLGREWMSNSVDAKRRVTPATKAELELWWQIVTDPNRVLSEVALCSKLQAQYQSITGGAPNA